MIRPTGRWDLVLSFKRTAMVAGLRGARFKCGPPARYIYS